MMNPNGNGFQLVASDWRGKAVDSAGQQIYKGGQRVDSGIIESVVSSYSLLVYHPIAAFALALGIFILVAEFFATAGPLEFLADTLLEILKNPDSTGFSKVTSSVALIVVHKGIDWKLVLAKMCLVWFTYIVKPSGRNMLYAAIITLIVLLMQVTFIKLIVITQLFFLFACIRSPFWKFVIFIFFVFFTFTDVLNFTNILTYVQDVHTKFNRTLP